MKKIMKKAGMALLAGILGAGVLAGCGSSGDSDKLIRIASKDLTENEIVTEIYALALEDAGYKVERKFNISSSVIHASITSDEIDIYPAFREGGREQWYAGISVRRCSEGKVRFHTAGNISVL